MEEMTNLQGEKEMLDKDSFMECMRSIVKKMNKQEQMIKLLVDDMNMRNHEGVLLFSAMGCPKSGVKASGR